MKKISATVAALAKLSASATEHVSDIRFLLFLPNFTTKRGGIKIFPAIKEMASARNSNASGLKTSQKNPVPNQMVYG